MLTVFSVTLISCHVVMILRVSTVENGTFLMELDFQPLVIYILVVENRELTYIVKGMLLYRLVCIAVIFLLIPL